MSPVHRTAVCDYLQVTGIGLTFIDRLQSERNDSCVHFNAFQGTTVVKNRQKVIFPGPSCLFSGKNGHDSAKDSFCRQKNAIQYVLSKWLSDRDMSAVLLCTSNG